MLEVDILNILLDLFKLFLIASPLLTCQVVHDELRLHLRGQVLLIEKSLEVCPILRLKATDNIQLLAHVQVNYFLVNVIADILNSAGILRYTNRSDD